MTEGKHEETSAAITARLDRLPATKTVWRLAALLSIGGMFEFYDLFFTGYVVPGLVRDGLLAHVRVGIFTGPAAFVAATFGGLFLGTIGFGFVADRFGRRPIFTASLLWYSLCTAIMAFQHTPAGLLAWRLVAGIGIGIELVTIDTYLAELVPKDVRGRAFAFNQVVQFSAVPVVALLSWQLVPRAPFGIAGWRFVVLIGALGAVFVWLLRRGLPESPRWLAGQGRLAEAARITAALEARVIADRGGRALPPPLRDAIEEVAAPGRFAEIWRPPYRARTIMLMVFQFFQTIGYSGFASWVPTLIAEQGIHIGNSLLYAFVIALANPFGPALALSFADRIERKWLIVFAAFGIAAAGLAFAAQRTIPGLVACGVVLTLANNILSFSFHAYQSELYPTRVRARAVGFVYSWSRLSAVFVSFLIAALLNFGGVPSVFVFIAGAMLVVMIAIGVFGPATGGRQLEAISPD